MLRPFFLHGIFWRSAGHAVLRRFGASRANAYRVMVRAEPVWLGDAETGERRACGLFATKYVVADSEGEAGAHAIVLVRDELVGRVGHLDPAPVFEVEESNRASGIVWRQPGGFTFYDEVVP